MVAANECGCMAVSTGAASAGAAAAEAADVLVGAGRDIDTARKGKKEMECSAASFKCPSVVWRCGRALESDGGL
jgi:hypothetical protein